MSDDEKYGYAAMRIDRFNTYYVICKGKGSFETT